MLFADESITFPLNSFWDTIFRQTWIDINIFGLLGPDGLRINLIGLIILGVVGVVAVAVAERLVGEKLGKSLVTAIFVALLGSYISAAIFKQLPFEIRIEDVPLFAGTLGAIVFGVFFVLLRRSFGGSAKKAA
jgi:uncharacterized membrane protein YeaQ/YmgE (transglycosylase-associated protein family)